MRQVHLSGQEQQEIVKLAREWLGTPYHHQASCKGIGTDCLGLVRGIFKEYTGAPTVKPPAYSRAWGESDGQELMLQAAHKYLIYIGDKSIANYYLDPGDVLIFRIRKGSVAKHSAIYVGGMRIIHAFEGNNTCEVELQMPWRKKIAGVFQFPHKS